MGFPELLELQRFGGGQHFGFRFVDENSCVLTGLRPILG